MSQEPIFTLVCDQDEITGKWSMDCPYCDETVLAYTAQGSADKLCEHLNENHKEKVRGTA